MDCPEPMRQGDEETCPKCPARWGVGEDRPGCMRSKLSLLRERKMPETISKEPTTGKRFLVFGGNVTSQSDGQDHYVPAQKIPALYGVAEAECVFYRDGMRESDYRELMHLGPFSLDNYREFLDRAKVEQFHDYVKQRKLRDRNAHRPEGRHLVPTHDKRIAMYEKRWPEFRAAFERWEAR